MRKGMEGGSDQLQELLATLAKVNQIDLGKVAEAAERAKSVQDRFREELEKGKSLSRRKPKKRHWRTKRKYHKEYYQRVAAPRKARAKAELLKSGGWFSLMMEGWNKRGVPVEVSREEWEREVGTLEDYVPTVERYDTRLPVRLDNVLVRDRDSGHVLFDGKEWKLRSCGYIL